MNPLKWRVLRPSTSLSIPREEPAGRAPAAPAESRRTCPHPSLGHPSAIFRMPLHWLWAMPLCWPFACRHMLSARFPDVAREKGKHPPRAASSVAGEAATLFHHADCHSLLLLLLLGRRRRLLVLLPCTCPCSTTTPQQLEFGATYEASEMGVSKLVLTMTGFRENRLDKNQF